MKTSKISYQSNLRTQATHLASGETIITDAPVDNHGKGEAFSPTDLMSTSLASCMMTIMGIAANTHHIKLGRIDAELTKVMASEPRRVAEIIIEFTFSEVSYTAKEKAILEHAARTCPVSKSLHPDLKQTISFKYI
jgi:putative redox protein